MKKILSLMLVFVMIFALATPALAANEGKYSFKDGVLTVSGTDEIPWLCPYKGSKSVRTLYICRGVKTLANFAFEGCSNLSRVEIPDTVTSLGKYAFDDTNIARIGIPKSVTMLTGYTFDTYDLDSKNSCNTNMVVYCEKGSPAEDFAKSYGLKYVNATMVYAVDGKTMMVTAEEKNTLIAGGNWFANPNPVKMYATDGRTKLVDKSKVEANKKVGWYTEPLVKMYATDGRTKMVEKSKVEANKKVGWYTSKPVKMYAADGRTKYVGANDVEANKKVGWYTEPVVKMYAADGRTKMVEKSKVEANKKVGWYTEPLVKMYAADGRTKMVEKSKVEANKKVGWYAEPLVKMYAADGRTKMVEKSKVEANKKVGWYDKEPTQTLYASDGRSKVFKKSQVAAQLKAGWHVKPVYVADGTLAKPYLATNGTAIDFDSWSGNKKIVLNVTGYARGENAKKIGYLDTAPAGQEWVLLKLKIKYISGSGELGSLYSVDEWLYKKSGSSYNVYEDEAYFGYSHQKGDIYNKGIANFSTYAGGSVEGYLAVLTDKGAEMPIIKVATENGAKFVSTIGAPELKPMTEAEKIAANPVLSKCKLTLPTVPQTLKNYKTSFSDVKRDYVDVLQSMFTISQITYKFEEGSGGNVNLRIYYAGEKTYDANGSGQNSTCYIGWNLYDSAGYVEDDGTTYTKSVKVGGKFKEVEEVIYDLEPGAYKLEIMSVNGID